MSRWNFPTSPLAHSEAIITGDKWRFTVLTDGLIRYEWADDGKFEDRASSFAICRQLPVPPYESGVLDDVLVIRTKRFRLNYNLSGGQFDPANFWADLEHNTTPGIGRYRYGADHSNLGGTRRTLDGAAGRVDMGFGVLCRAGFAFLDDSKSFLWEEGGWFAPRPEGNRIDGYLFAYGNEYRQAMKAFYQLSGNQPLIPRWALGNWWSRYHPYTDQEYLGLMDKFKEHNIPMTVGVVDMDWHRTQIPPKYGAGWTGYTWNRDLIPDPKEFLQALHDRGLRVTLNDHPALGVRAFEDQYKEMAKKMGRDPSTGDPLEFDCTDENFVDAFFDVVAHGLEDQGVDFWWIDWQQGTESKWPGVDPLFILNHYHYLDQARKDGRPLNFSRFPGPGGHRYPIGFSGDTSITWAALEFQPEFTATASNIGFGWWSHDIGGHRAGFRDDEMTTRWFQLGCFSPILRPHYWPNPFTSREPWDLSSEADQIISETMRLRHRLIPYLYSMNVLSAVASQPLIQPVYWEYPFRPRAYKVPNQYFFGRQLMIAPITSPRHKRTFLGSVEAWLAPGKYVDLSNGLVYVGDRFVTFHRTLSQYPHIARQGAILPLDGSEELPNGANLPDRLDLVVVVGQNGNFQLYEDDGSGTTPVIGEFDNQDPNPASVKLSATDITFDQKSGTLKISAMSLPNKLAPASRRWRARFVSHTVREDQLSASMHVNGSQTSFTPKLKQDQTGVLVDMGWIQNDQAVTLNIGPDPQLDENDIAAASWDILNRSIAWFQRKLDLYNAINGEGTRDEKWAKVQEIGGLPNLRQALKEVIFSDYAPES